MKLINFIKNSGKQRLVICILAVLLVVSGIVCINLNNKANHWKEKAAYENFLNWRALNVVASMYENDGDIESAIKARYAHNNGVLFWGIDTISPAFNGTVSYSDHFLTICYDTFTKDIAYEKLEGEQKEKAIQLFTEMNSDLHELCNYVEKHTESTKAKAALLDSKSDLYKTVEKRIKKFCDTYYQKIQAFYEEA